MSQKQRSAFSLPTSIAQNAASLRNGGAIFYHWNEQLQALPASPCIPSQEGLPPDFVPPSSAAGAPPGNSSYACNTTLTLPVNALKTKRRKSPPTTATTPASQGTTTKTSSEATGNGAAGGATGATPVWVLPPPKKMIVPANAKTATGGSVSVQRILPALGTAPVVRSKHQSAKSIQPIKPVRKDVKKAIITKKKAKPRRRSSTSSGAPVPVEYEWDHFFGLLQAHKEKHGTCTLRAFHVQPTGLSKFIAKTRALYKRGKLSYSQVQQLENIGFRWNLQSVYDEIWSDNFDNLVAYYKEHGTIDVPEDHDLFSFVRNSRRLYAARKMVESRQNKWEKLLLAIDSGDLSVLDLEISA